MVLTRSPKTNPGKQEQSQSEKVDPSTAKHLNSSIGESKEISDPATVEHLKKAKEA